MASPARSSCAGYNVMRGYFDDAAGDRRGDRPRRLVAHRRHRHDGRARATSSITDRKKDMFIVGGFNAYPAEIENTLARAPHRSRRSRWWASPTSAWARSAWRSSSPAPGRCPSPDELIAWSRERMANYKVPRRIEIVDALPLNASGKVLKHELRDADAAGEATRRSDGRQRDRRDPPRVDAVHARRAPQGPRGRVQPLVRARPLLRRLHGRAVPVRRPALGRHPSLQGPALSGRLADHARRRSRVRTSRSTGCSKATTASGTAGRSTRSTSCTPTAACSPSATTSTPRSTTTSGSQGRDADGVPPELALDHRFAGMVAVIGELADGVEHDDIDALVPRQRMPALIDGIERSRSGCASRRSRCSSTRRVTCRARRASSVASCSLYFTDDDPAESWAAFASRGRGVEGERARAGLLWAAPFIPTIPGTDTYTDQLW